MRKYVLHSDVKIAKLRRAHIILGPDDTRPVYAPSIIEALQWLYDQGELGCRIEDDNGAFELGFRPINTDAEAG